MSSIIAEILANQYSFIHQHQLSKVVEENRFCQVLVRCGNGRFVCAAQDAQHFIDIITREKSDYIRDISLYHKDSAQLSLGHK